MARGGINKVVVQKARTALLARGEHPSIDAVRVELGNTGSKSTIHRYLKELEATNNDRAGGPITLSEQLANLVNQLADQLQEEAQAAIAGEREEFGRERIEYHHRIRQTEICVQQLEDHVAADAERFQKTENELLNESRQRQQAEIEISRLQQANRDLEGRLRDRDAQICSLEEKHQHSRDALEHYRQASKEQREQDQRRNESQLQLVQLEIRQLQQTLIVKQDELTQLNRDNERLLTEARLQQRDQQAQQRQLDQNIQAREALQSQLKVAEAVRRTVEQRNDDLQTKLDSLSKTKMRQSSRQKPRRTELVVGAAEKAPLPAKRRKGPSA
ncbi:cointegrate resolution protein T [Pseudomonas sp. MTM4]|uniref:DNA-binding protein n=1 Tax=unclassified Pseudomonas TaxID=196821 RepID=UPI0018D1FDEA|nr:MULTISPECIES: DNA-binding protein [unclassified Pseudomonas]MBC8649243.1 cointegrate resolution protein T [Pseudomonas sp. MT4]QXY90599.1 cointegrate resolution protein T [Pseudomonas sp. MTM4]